MLRVYARDRGSFWYGKQALISFSQKRKEKGNNRKKNLGTNAYSVMDTGIQIRSEAQQEW